MNSIKRESPMGKPVSLFVTCMIDMLYPGTGMSVVEVLRHLGVVVKFPPDQTCCGQPAFNAGYLAEARQVAAFFLDAFKDAEVVVTPSGSCGAMVIHEYSKLFADDPDRRKQAERLASITWEFTEFIVDGLGITDLHAALEKPQTFAFHHACHGLHLLGLKSAGEKLVGSLENASILDWEMGTVCCGFGGLFSVKMAPVSNAMLEKKIESMEELVVDAVLTGDVSCLTHMNGGMEHQGQLPKVRHIADVLAEGVRRSR